MRRATTTSTLYEILGQLLLSGGVLLGCYLGVRLTRESVEDRIAQQRTYLMIGSTPVFELPAATPMPTQTATPIPTAATPTLVPLPAIRLSIPSIDLNIKIVEVHPTEKTSSADSYEGIWQPPAFAVGHYSTSGLPGGGRNIVLIGHNNVQGEAFRFLERLHIGDEVMLFTEQADFSYSVQKKFIIPYLGAEEDGDLMLQSYALPQSHEMVTMISCWPYATNSHRIVIIAARNPVQVSYDN